MILVDSSVWIDFFRGTSNPATQRLSDLLQDNLESLAVADLVLFEVLRGFQAGAAQRSAQILLTALPCVTLGGADNALRAAAHYRELRAQGTTIRSPIDVLLASYCIAHGHPLLHRDADFDALESLRGLQVWRH